MAQYFTDFGNDTIGAFPAGWTSRFNSPTVEIVADENANLDKSLRIAGGNNAWVLLSWDVLDSDPQRADYEVLIRLRRSGLSGTYQVGVMGRASGSAGSETGYGHMSRATFDGQINLLTGGSSSFMGQTGVGYGGPQDTYHYMRVRASGSTLELKRFTDLNNEQASYPVSVENSAITQPGWIGISRFQGHEYHIDWIGVGTGGDPAPSITDMTVFGSPRNVTAEALSFDSVKVTCSPVAEANSYDFELQKMQYDEASEELIAVGEPIIVSEVSHTEYTFGSLEATTTYRARVRARRTNPVEISDWSTAYNVLTPALTYNLNLSIQGQGTVNISPQKQSYEPNEEVTISSQAANDWRFQAYSGDLSGSNPTQTIIMTSHKTITASFIPFIPDPANINITPGTSQVVISWSTPTMPNATHVEIYRRQASDKNDTTPFDPTQSTHLVRLPISTTSYTDSNPPTGWKAYQVIPVVVDD